MGVFDRYKDQAKDAMKNVVDDVDEQSGGEYADSVDAAQSAAQSAAYGGPGALGPPSPEDDVVDGDLVDDEKPKGAGDGVA